MGIFSRKPKVSVCDMCGKADVEGCGSTSNHVERILGDQPSWLPVELREQAQGEYTWMCTRCDSFPAMKWPSDGGASAGMDIHLGRAHHVGQFATMGGAMPRVDMIPIR